MWAHEIKPVDFSSNINPLGISPLALKALDIKKAQFYPPPYSPELKKGIAKCLGVKNENITLGNGSMELIKDFCSLFLDKRDVALVLEPTFSEYSRYSKIYGKAATPILASKNLGHVSEDVLNKVHDKTRVIFIGRPNNPTGYLIPEGELREILDFANKKGIYVFLDEVFIEFSQSRSAVKLINRYKNLFVLRSFTKFFAMPGLRVGYGVGCKELIDKLEAIKPPWNINISAHDMALASLQDESYISKSKKLIAKERDFLAANLKKEGIIVYDSHANFLLLRFNWNSRDVKSELLNQGLLVRDCSNFHGLDTRFIRVSVRGRKDNLKLISALKEQVKTGLKRGMDCSYYPCHFQGQDCTFCFCPFYPCKDKRRGGFILGKKGNRVWSCKNCVEMHKKEVVKMDLKQIKKKVLGN